MLYGHIESYADRVDHFLRLRDTQDQTGGFQAFIALAFQPAPGTPLAHLPGTTGIGRPQDHGRRPPAAGQLRPHQDLLGHDRAQAGPDSPCSSGPTTWTAPWWRRSSPCCRGPVMGRRCRKAELVRVIQRRRPDAGGAGRAVPDGAAVRRAGGAGRRGAPRRQAPSRAPPSRRPRDDRPRGPHRVPELLPALLRLRADGHAGRRPAMSTVRIVRVWSCFPASPPTSTACWPPASIDLGPDQLHRLRPQPREPAAFAAPEHLVGRGGGQHPVGLARPARGDPHRGAHHAERDVGGSAQDPPQAALSGRMSSTRSWRAPVDHRSGAHDAVLLIGDQGLEALYFPTPGTVCHDLGDAVAGVDRASHGLRRVGGPGGLRPHERSGAPGGGRGTGALHGLRPEPSVRRWWSRRWAGTASIGRG